MTRGEIQKRNPTDLPLKHSDASVAPYALGMVAVTGMVLAVVMAAVAVAVVAMSVAVVAVALRPYLKK